VAAIVLAATLAGACGGDGPLSHHAHAQEASALCRQSRHIHGISLSGQDRPRAAARAIERAVEHQRAVLADLRDLDPPKAEKGAIARWLSLIEQLLDEADLMAQQIRRGDRTAASETATRVAALDVRSRELARASDIAPCRFFDGEGSRPA